MIDFSDRIKVHVPNQYLEDYPRFVLFVEKYYEWLYRNGGFSETERSILQQEQGWLKKSVDEFVQSGQLASIASTESEISDAIQAKSESPSPGSVSKTMLSDFILERSFDMFETADGDWFETSDGHAVETKHVHMGAVNRWIDSQGFFLPANSGENMKNIDEILLVRLVKHISLIKGTQKAAQLFFSIFFDEDIAANNQGKAFTKPKYNIFIIDESRSKIDDKESVIRDDYFYNEFSYVINVTRDYEYYKDIFESLYLKYIHPAGFKCFLVQVEPSISETHTFRRASQATFFDWDGFMHIVGFDIARFQRNVLLIEGESFNYVKQSLDCDSTNGWTTLSGTTRIGKTLSPLNSQNATVYECSGTTLKIQQTVEVVGNTNYTASYYVKLISGSDPLGRFNSEWKRIVTHFTTGAVTTFDLQLGDINMVAGTRLAFSCAQVELGSVDTSYIPTTTSGAQRAADIVVDINAG